MARMTKQDVLTATEEHGVQFIRLWFTDVLGFLKSFPITATELEHALDGGMGVRRLVPGYEAPVYISWARRNRSALVPVSMYKPGHERATRVESRCPDPVAEDLFEMSRRQRDSCGITSLPGSLVEATAEMEKSELVREAPGNHIFEKFIANKKIEWDAYRTHVSDFETGKYLSIL